MNALMTAIVLWLSANFALPEWVELPRVAYLPAQELAARHYRGFAGPQTSAPAEAREIVAIYDDRARTIYLLEGWTADTPANISVLVHEMVHHIQNVERKKFTCPQEREQLAYEAQERWLKLFGRDLTSEFEIDPMSRLVKTKCFY
jgi:hypothetical protein